MNQNERLDLILQMRYGTDYCALFNDNYDIEPRNEPDELYLCEPCQKVFTFEHNYQRHLRSSFHKRNVLFMEDDSDDGIYHHCDVCDISYTSLKFLERHKTSRKHCKKMEKMKLAQMYRAKKADMKL